MNRRVPCPSLGLGCGSLLKTLFAVKAVGGPSHPLPSWAGHPPPAAGAFPELPSRGKAIHPHQKCPELSWGVRGAKAQLPCPGGTALGPFALLGS